MSQIESGGQSQSIGEVLNVLKAEFPEVTVSKIRFLESEGLVHPHRSPSGYRKFASGDIERLRFILKLQRDQFLPLKVIRERLAEWESSGEAGGQPALSLEQTSAEQPAATTPAPVAPAPAPVDVFARLTPGVSMSRQELAAATSLTEQNITDLELYQLLRPKDVGGEPRYDEVALQVAKTSRQLIELGLEPRHLRMFASTADRWASLAEQMVLPLNRQRSSEARAAAQETVRELVRLGNQLIQTLLSESLSPYV
ncbi:MAG TPA: MerR family transcriptional regulator [Actinomycetota bacterium]|nr:MerR family transcriptional regulator [Actinomycetota bacterium]